MQRAGNEEGERDCSLSLGDFYTLGFGVFFSVYYI